MKRLFLLLALCGMVAVGCTEGGVDDNIDNGGNNTEQPGEDDDDENKEDETTFITDSEGNVVVEAEGGKVVVTVTTDIEYSVEIPEEAQSWLSVADTRTIRMEKLTFTVAGNNTFEERSANVELVDSEGKSLQTIKFLQHASDKVFEIDDEGKYIIEAQGGVIEVDVTTNIEYDVVIPDDAQQWISVADTRAEVRNEKLTFTVTANETFEERSADVELVDSEGKSLQTIKFLQHASDKVFEIDDEGKYIIEAQGGVIEVDVTTNIEYDVVIPDDAQQWISVADTRAEVRNEKLTFTVAANETFEERSADVELVDSKGKSLQTINFTQLAKSNVIANNEIWYTTTDNKRIIPPSTEPTVFGAYFISNTYSDGKGVLTFDGEITKIGNDAFKDIGNLASITIPDSVTSIGNRAFYDCTSLTSVTIGNGVTSIGDDAFAYCNSLTSVNITDIAAWCKISFVDPYSNPLYYAGNLYLNNELVTDLIIPDGATKIGSYVFYRYDLLTSITIPDSVTSIGSYAFEDCDSLTSVTIGKGVTSIGYRTFSGCTGELIVNCNIRSASTYDYGAFYFSRFTRVTIGDSVTSIGDYAFYSCGSLPSVTIPDSVTSIGLRAFEDCTSLKSVTIGKGVISIGRDAFSGCTGELIVNCNIPSASTSEYGAFYSSRFTRVTIGDSVTSIGSYAFSLCTSLTSVYITDIAAWCNISFGNAYSNPLYCAEKLYLNNELVTNLIIPDGATKIGRFAFYDYDLLTSITIPDSVTSIGKSAFSRCDSLTSVTIPDSVTSIGSYAFYICGSLASVTIPDSVTSIGDYAFRSCDSLKSVTIGKSVTSIGKNAFSGCTGELIVNCNIPSASTSEDGAFYGSRFTRVTIGDSVTSIGGYAFYSCDSLTSVTIVGNGVTSIGSYAFRDCTSLTSVTIGNGVTSIGFQAFCNCTSLTSVTIGNGVTSIGDDAFADCYSLKEVYCKPTTPPTGEKDMFAHNALLSKIYVPSNSVEAYKSASGWRYYASAIVGYDF